jgi:hypothetical protein
VSRKRSGDRWTGQGEPPTEVEITLVERDERAVGRRIFGEGSTWRRARARAVLLGVFVAAAIGATAAVAIGARHGGGRPRSAYLRAVSPRAHLPGAAGVAAAYGYPAHCLTITISAIDRTFARADFNHASLCGRFAGDPTAIFYRSGGAWRLVLDAVDYQCPVGTIPGVVQRALAVCP